jgi:hypothetical protein
VSRFDVAEGRRLLGRFVVVKGPTLLEDEQGAVLRVREAGAAGHTMVRHPTFCDESNESGFIARKGY